MLCNMSSKIRYVICCSLLLLLPLQAMAAFLPACHHAQMPCHGMMSDAPCCDHQSDQRCGTLASCSALSSIALFTALPLHISGVQGNILSIAQMSLYQSPFADNEKRPPLFS